MATVPRLDRAQTRRLHDLINRALDAKVAYGILLGRGEPVQGTVEERKRAWDETRAVADQAQAELLSMLYGLVDDQLGPAGALGDQPTGPDTLPDRGGDNIQQ